MTAEEVDKQGNTYVRPGARHSRWRTLQWKILSRASLVTKGLKSQWIAQVKDTAGSMLAQTDWMVVQEGRDAHRCAYYPQMWLTKRAAIVAECDRLEAAITACTDVEALIAVVGSQDWPKGN
jgi:hypothetical protein